MSSRLSCWRKGHQWGEVTRMTYSDLVGNLWRQQWCDQCWARRRILQRAWTEREAGR